MNDTYAFFSLNDYLIADQLTIINTVVKWCKQEEIEPERIREYIRSCNSCINDHKEILELSCSMVRYLNDHHDLAVKHKWESIKPLVDSYISSIAYSHSINTFNVDIPMNALNVSES